MNKLKIVAAIALVAGFSASIFAAGSAVGFSDKKLFVADDKNRATMLARSCGKSGRLLQDPLTNAYLCMYANQDGSTLTVEVSPYPHLDQLAHR